MDRRMRKTRDAIFNAFISLLSKKSYSKITVGEIIEIADIGRATFYAHFETKDYLLKELCVELFDHIFESQEKAGKQRHNIFECDNHDGTYLHLFKHIKKNDNNVYKLLSSKNNDLFLGYFESEVRKFITKRAADFRCKKPLNVPEDFWINHVTSTFISTLKWWMENKMQTTPEKMAEYFLTLV